MPDEDRDDRFTVKEGDLQITLPPKQAPKVETEPEVPKEPEKKGE